MFKVNNKNTRTTSMTSFCCFYCYFEYISLFLVFLLLVWRMLKQHNIIMLSSKDCVKYDYNIGKVRHRLLRMSLRCEGKVFDISLGLLPTPKLFFWISHCVDLFNNSTKYDKYPAGNYMFKVNNKNTRIGCEICSKLTLNTPERRQLAL